MVKADPLAVRRYASALYETARRVDAVDRVAEDLQLVGSTMNANPQLAETLVQRVAPDSAKRGILRRLFAERVHSLTLEFLLLLVDKRRESVALAVAPAFRKIADERQGIVRASVTSAVQLTEAEVAEARSALERLTGRQVDVDVTVQPDILGGLLVRVGDRVIDGSVKGQIARLRKALTGAGG